MNIRPTNLAPAADPAARNDAPGKLRQFRVLMLSMLRLFGKLRWSTPDRATFRAIMVKLWRISPYLVVIALPGSLLILPALAWWLNRRRGGKRAAPAAAG